MKNVIVADIFQTLFYANTYLFFRTEIRKIQTVYSSI